MLSQSFDNVASGAKMPQHGIKLNPSLGCGKSGRGFLFTLRHEMPAFHVARADTRPSPQHFTPLVIADAAESALTLGVVDV